MKGENMSGETQLLGGQRVSASETLTHGAIWWRVKPSHPRFHTLFLVTQTSSRSISISSQSCSVRRQSEGRRAEDYSAGLTSASYSNIWLPFMWWHLSMTTGPLRRDTSRHRSSVLISLSAVYENTWKRDVSLRGSATSFLLRLATAFASSTSASYPTPRVHSVTFYSLFVLTLALMYDCSARLHFPLGTNTLEWIESCIHFAFKMRKQCNRADFILIKWLSLWFTWDCVCLLPLFSICL